MNRIFGRIWCLLGCIGEMNNQKIADLTTLRRMRGNDTPSPICVKFCRMVGIPDIIICANFGDDRLRSLGVSVGQILPFPIGFRHHSYNSRATVRVCKLLVVYYFTHFSFRTSWRERSSVWSLRCSNSDNESYTRKRRCIRRIQHMTSRTEPVYNELDA